MNASTNNVITTISNGSTLGNGSNVNIRANSPFAGTKSVYMVLSGRSSATRTENQAPYALFGDVGGNFNAGNLPSGSYSITATAYSGARRGGTVLGTTTINFSVGTASSIAPQLQTLKAYPNPVQSDKVFISLPKSTTGKVYYSIFNASGVELDRGSSFTNGKQMEVQLNNYTTSNGGVYYIRVQTQEETYTIPLVKR